MYSAAVRADVLRLVASGLSLNETSRSTGVSRATIRAWCDGDAALQHPRHDCFRCEANRPAPSKDAYAHLLGLYLGDGCISAGKRGVFSLRIACCDDYPDVMDECADSMVLVRPGKVMRVRNVGCTHVKSYWKHWPCVFPQHGPGRKHERPIVLEDWQREIVEQHPGRFLRGLFHSDGCRITNWTTRTVGGEVKRYEYPRYFFTNASDDIRGLCCWALGLVGVEHRHPNERNISVAKRASVAVPDHHVGPKS